MGSLIANLKYRLRNFKNEHNPKYNGNGHFDGIKTGLDSQVKLICDRVVGCPVDSRTRHQRMMPEIRKMVTGHRFRTANHRDMRITMTVAAKVAIETEL